MGKILLFFPNFNLYETMSLLTHQPPLSLGYLASALERAHISYDILDATAERLNHAQIITSIEKIQPEFVGITTNIAMKYAVIVQAKLIRKHFPKVKIIMGGPWAAAEYKFILMRNLADVVVTGEGDYVLVDLLQSASFIEEDLARIKGIAYRSGNGIKTTPPREPIMNLDEIGYPSWQKFPISKYYTLHRATPFFPIMMSRGCPYNCINCTKIIHGNIFRHRSVESIISELDYLKERFQCKEILVTDDAFNANLKWAKQVLRAIAKRRSTYRFKIHLMNGIRADHIDEEFVRLAQAAGVYKVGIGIESGSQKVIDFLQKKLDLQALPRAITLLHASGIIINGFFMLGLPVETPNSLTHTIDFADRLNIDIAYFFKLVLFPGTKLYEYAKDHTKFLQNSISPYAINYFSTPLAFETAKLKPKDVSRAYQYSLIRFFFNPRRLLRLIKCFSFAEMRFFVWRFINFSVKSFLQKLL